MQVTHSVEKEQIKAIDTKTSAQFEAMQAIKLQVQ